MKRPLKTPAVHKIMALIENGDHDFEFDNRLDDVTVAKDSQYVLFITKDKDWFGFFGSKSVAEMMRDWYESEEMNSDVLRVVYLFAVAGLVSDKERDDFRLWFWQENKYPRREQAVAQAKAWGKEFGFKVTVKKP